MSSAFFGVLLSLLHGALLASWLISSLVPCGDVLPSLCHVFRPQCELLGVGRLWSPVMSSKRTLNPSLLFCESTFFLGSLEFLQFLGQGFWNRFLRGKSLLSQTGLLAGSWLILRSEVWMRREIMATGLRLSRG